MTDEPDELVPDPQVAREFNVTPMSIHRWTKDKRLKFPPIIKINDRNYRSRRELEAFKKGLVRKAIADRVEAAG